MKKSKKTRKERLTPPADFNERIRFTQAATWGQTSVYSQLHCCYCGRPVVPGAPLLMVARTTDGSWWFVDPREPPREDEMEFDGRYPLPVGPGCLRAHPEWKFAVIPIGASAP